MSFRHILLLAIFVWLSGCGTPIVPSAAPTLEAINIYYPGSLQPWADKLSDCSTGLPEAALYFFQQVGFPASGHDNDIILTFGNSPVAVGKNSYQVGWEQLVVVVNQENKLSKLSSDVLKDIFSGKVVYWEDNPNQAIQVWTYPAGEPARQVFDQSLALNGLLAPGTRLAPDPSAILKEVAKDANAVGFLPQSYMFTQDTSDNMDIKIIQLDRSMEQALRQPVIALTNGEPTGSNRNLINCLQNANP